MSESKLITFFKEASSYTEFEIRKKIYELTNNLDVDLIYDLHTEYERFCFSLKLKNKLDNEPDNQYENELRDKLKIELEKEVQNIKEIKRIERLIELFNRRKIYISKYLKDNSLVIGKNAIVDEANISEIIKDLMVRKMSDLPKNSRHKNNTRYDFTNWAFEDEYDEYSHHDDLANSEVDVELLDLSDTSLIEKVVYLEKLGVIEFLRGQRPFSTSANSVANVLSAITGAKPTSLQPIINPLINKDYYNKNYPLNSKKTVISVEGKLTSLGYEIKKRSKE
jgi:hypothetical protein